MSIITNKLSDYDVVIVGGGPGGLPAAIAAGRLGMKTLLLERNRYLGGMAAEGLPILAIFDREGNQVVRGIAQEFIDRLEKHEATGGHVKCPVFNSTTSLNPYWFRMIAYEMCNEAGVDVIFSANPLKVEVENNKIKGVQILAKNTILNVECSVLIDATGDGDVIQLAGADYVATDIKQGKRQPSSMVFTVGNVDFEALIAYIKAHPEAYKLPDNYGVKYSLDYFLNPKSFYFSGFSELIEKARDAGDFDIPRDLIIMQKQPNKGEMLINSSRLVGDSTDPIEFSKLEATGYYQIKVLMNFFKKYCPGFEDIYLANISNGIGVRDSRRIVGIKTMTKDILDNYSIPEDTIALAGYNVDIHVGSGLYFQPMKRAVGIPYGCLVSKNISGLIASGRLISIDPYVFGLTRVMGTCMAVGEAAGTAAALSIANGVPLSALDTKELREKLINNGAIVCI